MQMTNSNKSHTTRQTPIPVSRHIIELRKRDLSYQEISARTQVPAITIFDIWKNNEARRTPFPRARSGRPRKLNGVDNWWVASFITKAKNPTCAVLEIQDALMEKRGKYISVGALSELRQWLGVEVVAGAKCPTLKDDHKMARVAWCLCWQGWFQQRNLHQ